MDLEARKTTLVGGIIAIIVLGIFLIFLLIKKPEVEPVTQIEVIPISGEEKFGIVFAEVNFSNGKFSPNIIRVKSGAQVNFFNKSKSDFSLAVLEFSPCSIMIKPNESFGCVFSETKTYHFEDKISGQKGQIIVE